MLQVAAIHLEGQTAHEGLVLASTLGAWRLICGSHAGCAAGVYVAARATACDAADCCKPLRHTMIEGHAWAREHACRRLQRPLFAVRNDLLHSLSRLTAQGM
jgi:hypothetical protein